MNSNLKLAPYPPRGDQENFTSSWTATLYIGTMVQHVLEDLD